MYRERIQKKNHVYKKKGLKVKVSLTKKRSSTLKAVNERLKTNIWNKEKVPLCVKFAFADIFGTMKLFIEDRRGKITTILFNEEEDIELILQDLLWGPHEDPYEDDERYN